MPWDLRSAAKAGHSAQVGFTKYAAFNITRTKQPEASAELVAAGQNVLVRHWHGLIRCQERPLEWTCGGACLFAPHGNAVMTQHH